MFFSQIRVLYAFVAALEFLVALGFFFFLLFKHIVASKGNLVFRLLSIKYKRFVNFLLWWMLVLSPCRFKELLIYSRFTTQKLTV